MYGGEALVAIDAGFSHLGVVVLSVPSLEILEARVITTKKENRKTKTYVVIDDIRRLRETVRVLQEVTQPFLNRGRVYTAVEFPSGGAQSGRAHRAMGMATALLVAWGELNSLPMTCITPMEVKKAVTGKKHASKQEVIDIILQQGWNIQLIKGRYVIEASYPVPHEVVINRSEFEHIADALGVALHEKEKSELYRIMSRT